MTASLLEVPRVALGCGNFGGLGSALQYHDQGLTDAQAFELMDASWELGITHFDTSDAYGGGRSEKMIGAWIRSRGVMPTLTTKTLSPLTVGGDHGLKRERIARALPASLERLGVDHVDLYLAHGYDPDVPISETVAAFEELAAAGTIGAYGVSNFSASQLEDSCAAGSPAGVQNAYSMLVREDEDGVLPICAREGVGYMAYSPLAGGLLTGKYRAGEPYDARSRVARAATLYERFLTVETFAALERLQAIARRRGVSMAGLAMAWVFAEERVAQVVTGPVKLDHFGPIREALDNPLTGTERAEITQEVFG